MCRQASGVAEFEVNAADDLDDGACGRTHCSLP